MGVRASQRLKIGCSAAVQRLEEVAIAECFGDVFVGVHVGRVVIDSCALEDDCRSCHW